MQIDIYSFGVVLWELVTRSTPRRGAMRNVRVPQECPRGIADLIARCKSQEPRERPSARDLLLFLSQSCVPLLP